MRFLLSPLCLALFAATVRALAAAAGSAPPYEAMLKIDAHSHVFEDFPEIHALFRRLNVRTINVCNNGTDEHLARMHDLAFDLYRQHPTLYPFESTFDLLKRDEPDYQKHVIAWLGRTFERGAVGVKIWKEVGLEIKYQDRLLYGVDQTWKPYLQQTVTDAQRQGHVNRLELRYRADYDYYAGKGAVSYDNRKVEALNLPRSVLEKFYHGNAERLFKLEVAWAGRN